MSVQQEFTIPVIEDDQDDLSFLPRVVQVNYNAYNCSVDSRYSEHPNSRLSSMKNMNGNPKGRFFDQDKASKKQVRFALKPHIILIKSYKNYNRTGKHKENCECKIF